MAYFNSLGTEIPDYLWELGLAVRRLIEQYEAMDLWRRHVRRWVELVREAAEKPNYTGVDVMDLPLAPEIDEEYALLAAVHDNCASPERNEELIHPWAAEADFGGSDEVVTVNPETLDAIATYVGLMQDVLPEQGRRGIDQSKGHRLHDILQDVAHDIRNAAKLWGPERSSCSDAPVDRDPVEKYASFLRRADTETGNGGSTTQAEPTDEQETVDDNEAPPEERRWLIGTVRDWTGLSPTPFQKYVKEAGCAGDGRRTKSYRFTDSEARRILECVRDNCPNQYFQKKCKEALLMHFQITS